MESVSEIFRTPAAPYAFIEARQHLWSIGWLPLVLVIVLFFIGTYDLRFAVLAMMIVCVVYPMLLLLAWLKLTGSKEMSLRLRPQRWERLPDGSIEIEYYTFEATEDSGHQIIAKQKILPADIQNIEKTGKYYIIHLIPQTERRLSFHLLPSHIITENPTLLTDL